MQGNSEEPVFVMQREGREWILFQDAGEAVMSTATITREDTERDQNERQAEAQVAGLARLGMLIGHQTETDYLDELLRHIEEREQIERDNALSIEVERTVRIVLCTGGPHAEIVWPERGTPSLVCYGWFGAGRYERDLTPDEITGITYAYGDWETLARIEGDR